MTFPVIRGGVTRITLDEVWSEAETLGEVAVDSGWSDGPYHARVVFKNGPSRIYANGKGKTPTDALMSAITEARRLGAARP